MAIRLREREGDVFMVRVEKQQEVVVRQPNAAVVGVRQAHAGHVHPHAPRKVLGPLDFSHFLAVGLQPAYILRPVAGAAGKEMASAQRRVLAAQPDHIGDEIDQCLLLGA